MICGKCGREHLTTHGKQACPGHILSGERKGEPCTHELGFGTPHKGIGCCKFHGGSTESHVKAANAEIVDREARRMLGIEGYEAIVDPYSALADLAGEVVKLKDVLRAKVEDLDTLRSFGGAAAGEQLDVIMQAYERALDRSDRILSGMARLDLEDRIARLHTRINTDAVEKILTAMNESLDDAGITGAAREVIAVGFGARLRGDQPTNSKSPVAAKRSAAALVEDSTT